MEGRAELALGLFEDYRELAVALMKNSRAPIVAATCAGILIAWRMLTTTPSQKKLPPGRMGWPLIGETLAYVKDPQGFVAERRKEFGDVFTTHVFFRPTIFIGGPRATGPFIKEESKAAVSSLPTSFLLLHGKWSALNQRGSELRSTRSFIRGNLAKLKTQLVAKSSTGTRAALAKTPLPAQDLKIVPFISNISFQVMNETFIGAPMPDDFPELFARFNAGMMSPVALNLPFTTFGKGLAARKKIYDHIASILPTEPGSDDYLSLMRGLVDESNKPLPDDQIISSGLLMVWGAHYEVVIGATSCLYNMTRHPEVLERVLEEVDSVMTKHDGEVNIASVQQCKYLEAVCKESLRIAPPSGGGMRLLEQDIQVLDFTFPKGYVVTYDPRIAFNDETIFPEPHKFDPTRFLGDSLPQHSFYPGGIGAHSCPGMASGLLLEKVILMELLLKWKPALLEGPVGVPEITTLPFHMIKENYGMNFTRRDSSVELDG